MAAFSAFIGKMKIKRPHLKPGDLIQVHIDRLSTGGRGVARHEGLVLFVPDTAPDEDIEVRLTLVKKNFAEASLTRILRPSPHRVAPPCPVAGTCGGCPWQHVAYPEQLKQKRELVRDALRKFSGFDTSSEGLVRDVVPSPLEFRYRNRIQVHTDGKSVGFHKRGSHQIIEVEDCLIAEKPLVERFAALRAQGVRGRTEIFLSESGEVVLRNATSLRDDEEANELAFSQVNSAQNQNLVNYTIDTLKRLNGLKAPSKVLDLYAGNGNFTFPLADAFPNATIESAELNPRSVKAARVRAQSDYPNRALRIEEADVSAFLAGRKQGEVSTIVLDPPRIGCSPDVLNALVKLAPEKIIYISCHPVTLARDLSKLGADRYKLLEVQPFDMFPQTDHVESVAVLERID